MTDTITNAALESLMQAVHFESTLSQGGVWLILVVCGLLFYMASNLVEYLMKGAGIVLFSLGVVLAIYTFVGPDEFWSWGGYEVETRSGDPVTVMETSTVEESSNSAKPSPWGKKS